MQTIDGNRYAVEVVNIGSATALLIHGIPDPYFNRAFGMRSRGMVRDVIRFYRRRQTPNRFDVDPFTADPRSLEALIDSGFRPAHFQTNLYGVPGQRRAETPPSVVVREVRSDELDLFSALYEKAYNHGRLLPRGVQEFRRLTVSARFYQPGWRFYMAIVDGMPAGGAVLYVRDGVATMAGAATIPTLRGRGCQQALLLHRFEVAGDLGCDLVVSRCPVGSPSQRNMERCGLSTAYTKVVWQEPDARSQKKEFASRLHEVRRRPIPTGATS